jgi:hypothetical protein
MKRLIAAVFLTALASTALGQKAVDPLGRYVLVEEGQTPPVGYAPYVPSYEYKDGRFVRNGEVYKSLHGGN